MLAKGVDVDSERAASSLAASSLSDEEVIARVLSGETAAFEIIMRRYNSRVFRAARSIVKSDDEAEDVMQQAYVNAFASLAKFEGKSLFSTWLLRITIYEAISRRRKSQRQESLSSLEERMPAMSHPDPEAAIAESRLLKALEGIIDEMPEHYRTVLVLRTIEGMSAKETAEALDIPEETVRTRLHRARGLLTRQLHQRADSVASRAFDFHLSRCDRVVLSTMQRILGRA